MRKLYVQTSAGSVVEFSGNNADWAILQRGQDRHYMIYEDNQVKGSFLNPLGVWYGEEKTEAA